MMELPPFGLGTGHLTLVFDVYVVEHFLSYILQSKACSSCLVFAMKCIASLGQENVLVIV
jgi:hypothetical protein